MEFIGSKVWCKLQKGLEPIKRPVILSFYYYIIYYCKVSGSLQNLQNLFWLCCTVQTSHCPIGTSYVFSSNPHIFFSSVKFGNVNCWKMIKIWPNFSNVMDNHLNLNSKICTTLNKLSIWSQCRVLSLLTAFWKIHSRWHVFSFRIDSSTLQLINLISVKVI